jgi:hypothetical protein
MTIPAERTKAILKTRDFLENLNRVSKTPGVPLEIRQQAHDLLRHYPLDGDMKIAAAVCPAWFGYDAHFGMQELSWLDYKVYRFLSNPERAVGILISGTIGIMNRT